MNQFNDRGWHDEPQDPPRVLVFAIAVLLTAASWWVLIGGLTGQLD